MHSVCLSHPAATVWLLGIVTVKTMTVGSWHQYPLDSDPSHPLLLCSDDGRAEGSTLDKEAPHQGGVRGQAERDPESGGPRDGTHQVEQSRRRARSDCTESLQTQLVANWPNYI